MLVCDLGAGSLRPVLGGGWPPCCEDAREVRAARRGGRHLGGAPPAAVQALGSLAQHLACELRRGPEPGPLIPSSSQIPAGRSRTLTPEH